MIDTQTCHTLVCDECRQVLDNGEDCVMHFDEVEDARSDAQQYYEWTRDGDRDLCPSCTCANVGHRKHIGGSGFVYCDRCHQTLLDSITAQPNASYL